MRERWLYLRGGEASLLIDAQPTGGALPRIVHFGADLDVDVDFEALVSATPAARWGARLDAPCPPCVLPGLEAGSFGAPALEPSHTQGWTLCDVERGAESVRLSFELRDAAVTIDYQLSPHGVLGMRVRGADFPDGLSWMAALALPLPMWAHEVMSFGGDWAREFAAHRQTLANGSLVFESRRGRPGHDRFPGLLVGQPGFGEDHGAVFGVTLAWSGSHRISVERLREGDVIVQAGELLLETTDDAYESPWAYAAYSPRGVNGVMQSLHAFLRERILRPAVARKPRPVHYNTWEAIYFKHDEATLRDLANRAAAVGAERFVLDDGWFRGRNDDRAGLGDWTADPVKFPQGLTPLIEYVRGLGLEFGLWIEPEMVNPDSDLARARPDWLRRESDGLLLLQRNQVVLDLGNPDVAEHLFEALSDLLSSQDIGYLKWDMNRDLTGVGSDGLPRHGAYVRALYALIDRLRRAHPDVEIESCASGGGRVDWGMLARAERVWVSDSNDALDRIDIQSNAFVFLPPEIAGAHVGPAACHITGRRLSLDLRAHVAMFGHMGLELDLRSLTESEAERLKAHIANYKRFRSLIHAGRMWRLETDADHVALGVTAADASESLVLLVRVGSATLGRGVSLRFPNVMKDAAYQLTAVAPISPSVEQSLSATFRGGELVLNGTWLTSHGLDVFLPRPETSVLIHARRI